MAKFSGPLWVGFFDDPQALLEASKKAKERGFQKLDAFTPFPIHGLEKALGLGQSWVPYVTLVCGLGGATLGHLFMYWTSAIDWPLNIGGKPLYSWPAFIPITFEMGILLGGVSTFFALLVATNLPRRRPLVIDTQLTNNRFALAVPEKQPVAADLEDFLKGVGAFEIRRISG